MSHFSETLELCMQEHVPPLNNVALGKLSGVDSTLISRYLNGRMSPTEERVAQLCAAISPHTEVRARLLVAYLRDVMRPCSEIAGLDERHVSVRVAGSEMALSEPSWFDSAPVQLQCMLEAIGREALSDPKVEELLAAVVNIVAPVWKKRG